MPLALLRIIVSIILIFTQSAGPGSIATGSSANLVLQADTTKVVSNTGQQSGINGMPTQQGTNRKAAIDAEMRPRLLRHGFTNQQIDKIFQLSLAEAQQRSNSAQSEATGGRSDLPGGSLPGGSPDVRIDPGEYRASVEDFGGIKIVTNPEGAQVKIDDKSWDDSTDCSAFTHSGTRIVWIRKTGYKPVTRTVIVPAGDWVSLEVTLEKTEP